MNDTLKVVVEHKCRETSVDKFLKTGKIVNTVLLTVILYKVAKKGISKTIDEIVDKIKDMKIY